MINFVKKKNLDGLNINRSMVDEVIIVTINTIAVSLYIYQTQII